MLGSGHFGIVTEENARGFECFSGGCQVAGVPAAFGDGEIHVTDAQGGIGGFGAFRVSIDDFLKGSGRAFAVAEVIAGGIEFGNGELGFGGVDAAGTIFDDFLVHFDEVIGGTFADPEEAAWVVLNVCG